MQVFGEWMQEWLVLQDEEMQELSERMRKAFDEVERRYKEELVERMLEEAESAP